VRRAKKSRAFVAPAPETITKGNAMKPTYTKLAADGSDLPADSTEKHLAVRVDHPMLKSPIIVAAYRAGDEVAWKNAAAKAEGHTAYGWQWRLPTVEELFFIADRTNPAEQLDPNFFPDAEGWEYTWSSDVDAESPSDSAWGVDLGYGLADRYLQSNRIRVRAVRAGQ
jgi:hypothetical protein